MVERSNAIQPSSARGTTTCSSTDIKIIWDSAVTPARSPPPRPAGGCDEIAPTTATGFDLAQRRWYARPTMNAASVRVCHLLLSGER
jgi:hypothetical protein